jgi:hypothetical protein
MAGIATEGYFVRWVGVVLHPPKGSPHCQTATLVVESVASAPSLFQALGAASELGTSSELAAGKILPVDNINRGQLGASLTDGAFSVVSCRTI